VRSFDPVRKAVAIWEALEHYTEGTKLPKPFTRAQRDEIRRRALETPALTDEQRLRVEDVLRFLNKPSAVTRLEEALKKDHINYSEQELIAAGSLREARTSGVHGVTLEADPADIEPQLEIALGFTTRLLAQWGYQLADSTEGAPGRRDGNDRP
jgi:hypothetical protein